MGKRVNADGFCEYTGFWWKLALPQVILGVHLGVAGAALTWAWRRSPFPSRAVVPGLLAGFALWTLFEYVLHRWLLHHTRRPLLRRLFWQALHKEHHAYPQMHDPDHHGVHVAIGFPIVVGVITLAGALSDGGFEIAAAAGWVLGYCAYEGLHWLFHDGDPEQGLGRIPTIRRLWDAHTVHHLEHANTNYGFVTTVWDRVFGTHWEPSSATEAHCRS